MRLVGATQCLDHSRGNPISPPEFFRAPREPTFSYSYVWRALKHTRREQKRKSILRSYLRHFFRMISYVFLYADEPGVCTLATLSAYHIERPAHHALLLGAHHSITLARGLSEPHRIEHAQPPA
jgi:hypothetical protein